MKVSVLMLTYNHESFIRQAIESVLAQQTTFEFELVVSEDCSKDSTRSIVEFYEAAHPGKVRGLYRTQNLGMIENTYQTYRACLGTYIAVLDGDDYWIDPLKLQKQADFLDRHPEFAISFHDTYRRTDTSDVSAMSRECPTELRHVSTFVDLLANNFIPFCSVMWRNLRNDLHVTEGLRNLKVADWPLHLLHAQRGEIGYIPEVMGVYRVSATGGWSQLGVQKQLLVIMDIYKYLDRHFNYQYSGLIQRLIYFSDIELSYRTLLHESQRAKYAIRRLGIPGEMTARALVRRLFRVRETESFMRNAYKAPSRYLQSCLRLLKPIIGRFTSGVARRR